MRWVTLSLRGVQGLGEGLQPLPKLGAFFLILQSAAHVVEDIGNGGLGAIGLLPKLFKSLLVRYGQESMRA